MEENQFVTVRIGSEVFGVPIEIVEGIIAWEPLIRLPKTPAFLSGLLSVRGNILPVIDLRVRLEVNVTSPSPSHRILLLQMNQFHYGAIVDAVCSVERLAEGAVERNIPMAIPFSDTLIAGIARREQDMVILLKPEGLLSENERHRMETVTRRAEKQQAASEREPVAA